MNSGLLAAHGTGTLCTGQNGEYIARYTTDFHRECARGDLLPGEVLVQLLTYMHPMGDVPHPDMIRACIVFAHDQGWNIVKESLELEFEPPTTPDEYMSQLVFADKFELKNLLRVNIQRAESSCRELAEILEKHGKLKLLKDRTREGIMDRMCSGWGLNPVVNRLSTRSDFKLIFLSSSFQVSDDFPQSYSQLATWKSSSCWRRTSHRYVELARFGSRLWRTQRTGCCRLIHDHNVLFCVSLHSINFFFLFTL